MISNWQRAQNLHLTPVKLERLLSPTKGWGQSTEMCCSHRLQVKCHQHTDWLINSSSAPVLLSSFTQSTDSVDIEIPPQTLRAPFYLLAAETDDSLKIKTNPVAANHPRLNRQHSGSRKLYGVSGEASEELETMLHYGPERAERAERGGWGWWKG